MNKWLEEIDALYEKYHNTPEGNGIEFLTEVWKLIRRIVNRSDDGYIKICPICGKVDATQKHIDNCNDTDRCAREDNSWK